MKKTWKEILNSIYGANKDGKERYYMLSSKELDEMFYTIRKTVEMAVSDNAIDFMDRPEESAFYDAIEMVAKFNGYITVTDYPRVHCFTGKVKQICDNPCLITALFDVTLDFSVSLSNMTVVIDLKPEYCFEYIEHVPGVDIANEHGVALRLQ